MKNIEEIKNKANEIISNNSVNIISQEKEIFEELNRIINSNEIDVKKDSRTLYEIEIYLNLKSKLSNREENYEYLKELSRELKSQRVRESDNINKIPLFKVEYNGEDCYFITRQKAHNFMKAYNISDETNIEIEEINSEKISKLILEIEENF